MVVLRLLLITVIKHSAGKIFPTSDILLFIALISMRIRKLPSKFPQIDRLESYLTSVDVVDRLLMQRLNHNPGLCFVKGVANNR